MSRVHSKFRARDWVEVKSPREIAPTLDADGTLDGLPFMPEMEEFCGRRFQVERLAGKICVEYPGGKYRMRRFRDNQVVILKMARCAGTGHDGCQRACVMFWKSPWLRKIEAGAPESPAESSSEVRLRGLKSTTAPGRYFCQSTELDKATMPLSRLGVVWNCIEDVTSGSRGVLEMARMVFLPMWRYATQRFRPRLRVGNLTRTPVGDLNLQPGEWVTIKTEDEILKTLDKRFRNRGLTCDRGMRQFCGGTFQVRNRLDRLISESSGEMRPVESTVILGGLHCLCEWNHVGGCPREDLMYWREIWLERAAAQSERAGETAGAGNAATGEGSRIEIANARIQPRSCSSAPDSQRSASRHCLESTK